MNGYTFNPANARFELSHADMQIPASGGYYSVNESNSDQWLDNMCANLDKLKNESGLGHALCRCHGWQICTVRFSRAVFSSTRLMPRTRQVNCVCCMKQFRWGFIMEQAGGKAMSKDIAVLDIEPEALHQRVPVYLGAPSSVDTLLG